MVIIDISEAKIHLSKMVEAAANGESFIISMAGKPMVKVMALDARVLGRRQRLGFMKGQGSNS